jgi:hypothetical protein
MDDERRERVFDLHDDAMDVCVAIGLCLVVLAPFTVLLWFAS